MNNIEKLNKSMEHLISSLLTMTTAIEGDSESETVDFEKVDVYLGTVNQLTTNIKRMFDTGVSLNGGEINQDDTKNNLF